MPQFHVYLGQIEEDGFLEGVKRIPSGILEHTLGFQILPDEMKERLHKNLQEVGYFSAFCCDGI